MKPIVLTCVLAICAIAAFGQSAATRPSFEVASIKLSKSAEGSDSHSTPGYLRMQGSLKSIIRIAYAVRLDQVEGGPVWIDQEHYQIEARANEPATGQRLLDMLQTLLVEKFKLEFHRETKSVSGYALIRDKGSLKMSEVKPGGLHLRATAGSMTGQTVSMADLATNLSRTLGMPVTDETGLAGFFDFTLKWAPEKTTPSVSTADPSLDSGGPSIFTAIQEQLGLKLEPRKVSKEILVVDRAEKPPLN